ncbi:MAG: hypothetical protein AB7R40_23320 [Nitrospiraceae bacterium]
MSEPTQKHTVESLAAEVTLGTQAENFCKSEAFQRAYTIARAILYEEWTAAKTREERELVYAETKGLDRIVAALEAIQLDGQSAQEAIRKLRAKDVAPDAIG